MLGSTARRRHTWLPKVLFMLGSFAAAGLVAAGVVSGADQPSISSDRSDFAPGDAVALSGGGWLAGEAVQVLVDDDQSNSWSHEAALTAGADGSVSDSFDLPDVAGEFSVTATAVSGTASASFTATAPTPPTPPTTRTPTLESDEEEYAPGATVTFSGAEWQAGDTVHLSVDDDADDAWDHAADVNVAADGTITDTFDLPDGLAADFTATATDPANRTATATFETVAPGFGAATEPHLVRFASGTSTETQAQILTAAGAEDTSYIAPLRIHGVLLPGGVDLQPSIDRLRSYPSVTRVEPDRTREAGGTPNDSNYGDQWSLTKIGWENAFGTVSPNGSARVAILDTGIDGSHPDLDANVVPGTSILDGSNGLSDPNGHGTAMAGIVAAETDNGAGIAGVGYAGVQVMPVTVLDSDGTGQDSDIIEGVVYAADNGADVILMAFSNPGYSEMLQAAIDYAWDEGAVLVAATGNDGSSAATFPAGDRSVIGVSNTDRSDALEGSSNYGQAVFLGAPGTGIATTAVGGGYTSITGTSASAAEVAGAAALLRAAYGASNGVVVSRLAKNAEPAGSPQQTGNGRLNLDRALADTSTGAIQPAGAAPVGGGGPYVGPYVAASNNFNVAPLAQNVSAASTNDYTWTFTAQNSANVATTTFTVPADWTAPTSVAGPGQITVTAGTCAASLNSVNSVTRVITINQQSGSCSNSQTFSLTYNDATAPIPALPPQTYTFTNQHGQDPQVTVTAVVNTAPTVAYVAPPTTANEGQSRTYSFTITDPDAGNTFTFVTGFPACGTGGTLVGGSASINNVAKTGTFQCLFADGPTTPNVQVRVQDNSNAQSNTASLAVTVANVPPAIAITGAASANEGSVYTLTLGAVTDPGTDTITSHVVHWGDGNTDTYSSNGVKSHTYADGPATRAITVDLVDEDGTHLNRGNALSVPVDNVAPSITISGAANVNEASPYSLTLGAVTDPGTDTLSSYVVHWGDGNTDTYSSNGVKTHAYADGPATRAITVDLVDEDGTFLNRANALSVQVDNVPPTITAVTAVTPIDEGASSLVTVTATDPAGVNDPLAYQFDCDGNNTFEVGPQAGSSHSCSYADNGNFTANVRVTDGDGGADTDSTTVVVNNVPPSIAISGAASVNEGSLYSLTLGAVTDPGADTVSSYVVHWGDGDSDTYATNGVKTHTYTDGPDDHAIKVDLVDEDGTFLDRANALSAHVNNVPPTVTLAATNTYTWPESATAERTFDYTASDPAGANDPLTMTINCGTGGVYVAGSDTGSSFKCRFPDGPASPNVSVSANDGDGGVGSDSHAVTVNNVPPTVAKPTFQPVLIACQTSTTLTAISFSDPGANDNPWTVDIDWGDSSAHTTYITATQGAQPNQDHTYSTPGPHTATVTVTDKDTDSGSNTSTAPVTVFQYTVDFLPPFDDSTPSGLIVNKMKNGRVVPVKARIRDECAGSIVTDPAKVVTIKASKTSGSGTGDPIEEYADAGQSSAGTNEFRPTGDHWIYNLDSKALGLVINNLYRIDVYVDGVKATVTNWAVLQPVK